MLLSSQAFVTARFSTFFVLKPLPQGRSCVQSCSRVGSVSPGSPLWLVQGWQEREDTRSQVLHGVTRCNTALSLHKGLILCAIWFWWGSFVVVVECFFPLIEVSLDDKLLKLWKTRLLEQCGVVWKLVSMPYWTCQPGVGRRTNLVPFQNTCHNLLDVSLEQHVSVIQIET